MRDLQSAEAWVEAMGLLVSRDGYVVIGAKEPYRSGQTIKDRFQMGSDFLVTKQATHEDALRQKRYLEEFAGTLLPSPEWPDYFYKTVMVSD